MDRNTIIGFVLIFLIVIGYTFLNAPSQEELARKKFVEDSVMVVRKQQVIADSIAKSQPMVATDSVINAPDNIVRTIFFDSALTRSDYTIENELLKITLSNLGGKVQSAELKKYKTHDQRPLMLLAENSNQFGFTFPIGNSSVNTNDILFSAEGNSFEVVGADSNSIRFRAYYSPQVYVEHVYSLKGNSYLLDYDFNLVGMDSVLPNNVTFFNFQWSAGLAHTEKDLKLERNNSTVYYQLSNGDVNSISERSVGSETITDANWISFKQHFFNAALISKIPFDQGEVTSDFDEADTGYVKSFSAESGLPYEHGKAANLFPMQFYFGPNSYSGLKKLDIDLEKIIPLNIGIFGTISSPISKYVIIPIFNWLNHFSHNYGLIILIMTIILRLALFPLNYRSFVSAAKMKVLQPEIAELKEKYKGDQARFGQEQMKLFRQAGVNPLGGCIPLLLQLPILTAMYVFFPLSIELRQESLWWATDLSTYDSIFTFPNNFSLPFYGNHISLWTLLMTITSIGFAVYNNQFSNVTAQMKWMTYLFPIMLLGIFNSLPAALTYYYTLTNVFSFIQTWVAKTFIINEDTIHQQIQENKKKPMKKSRFQDRLEKMQRGQMEKMRQKK